MFANTDGSWLWASQLSDERHLAQFEQMHEASDRSKGQHRPPLVGYDTLVAAINGLRNDLRVVNRLPVLPGPKTPLDTVKERRKAVTTARLDALLGEQGREGN